jgi:AraC-like DNA-binding protein
MNTLQAGPIQAGPIQAGPPQAGYENDVRFIPAHYQPAVLVDLALRRGIDTHRLLRGTGLFYEDILTGKQRVSPLQFFRLIDNCRQLMAADDCSFLFGQQLLPGHYGAASHALQHAENLHQALERLVKLKMLLSPLLTPRLRLDEHYAYLVWIDNCGAGMQRNFLIEANMTAVTAMCRWMSGERLPWHYQLNYAQPRYIEQYWVHMGEDLRFDCPLNMMRLPRTFLVKPWSKASTTAGQVAEREGLMSIAAQAEGGESSFLDTLFEHLYRNIRQPVGLERVAESYGVSAATFKRKLKRQGTHFQEQLDQVRLYVALDLYLSKGYTSEEVAAYLHFNDQHNFRRSFKRWTGMLPSELKARLS